MLLMLLVLVSPSTVAAQEVDELQINSKRYIVVDIETGSVFAQKGARDRVAIASLTKLFTADQAMAMAPLDTPITTADSDLRSPDGDYFGSSGTLMGFDAGQTYTLEDMIYGMLLPSGNDAANAIARTLGNQPGDTADQAIQRFVVLMNQRLKDMGLNDTHLMNPHGWGVPDHYSSAWDVAAFTRYVSSNRTLVEIMGTRSYTTSNELVTVTNTNRLLSENEFIVGGKTGYDLDAGYCLVNIAGRGDDRMVAVTLDGIAPGDWYDDNRVLLEYGFEQKSSLLDSDEPFDGDVAAYIDPAAADVARSATSSGSLVAPVGSRTITSSLPAGVQTERDDQGGDRQNESVLADRQRASWILAALAIALVAFRGLLTFRRASVEQASVDSHAEDS